MTTYHPSLISVSTMNSDETYSTLDINSICRLQLQSIDEYATPVIQAPFLFPTSDDKASAARSSQLASAILTIGDTVEQSLTIKYLLAGGAPQFLNSRDHRGRTPLMHAITCNEITLIKLLISCPKIDLTTRDRFGNTTLMYASGHGHRDILIALLEGIKKRSGEEYWPNNILNYVYAENYDEETAFTLAFAGGHDDCINVLSNYFKEALYEDERRKCSFIYRIGIRSAAVARALTNLHIKNGISKRRRQLWRTESELREENQIDQQPENRLRRAQSQETIVKKIPVHSVLNTLIMATKPNMALDLAISYGKQA